MSFEIRYTAEALRDLNDIWDYLLTWKDSSKSAEKVVEDIEKSIDYLKTFPQMGKLLSQVTKDNEDEAYRFLVTRNYLVFYRVEEQKIYIDRILHGKQDYIRCIFQNLDEEETEE